ncbi:MAG: response regulator [Bacteroidia bacterium]|nr:response regulator [Bacteroidia bacterium]
MVSVFIADDEKFALEVMKEHLSANPDFNIKTFDTGEECLKSLDENPDFIVLDYYLDLVNPDAMNGLDVMKKIKEFNPKIEVIMLTGQDDSSLVFQIVNEGALDYVMKDEDAFSNVEKIIREALAGASN